MDSAFFGSGYEVGTNKRRIQRRLALTRFAMKYNELIRWPKVSENLLTFGLTNWIQEQLTSLDCALNVHSSHRHFVQGANK